MKKTETKLAWSCFSKKYINWWRQINVERGRCLSQLSPSIEFVTFLTGSRCYEESVKIWANNEWRTDRLSLVMKESFDSAWREAAMSTSPRSTYPTPTGAAPTMCPHSPGTARRVAMSTRTCRVRYKLIVWFFGRNWYNKSFNRT